jgi:hypothetical protein
VSILFGVLMIAAAAVQSSGVGLVVSGAALVALGAGVWWRPAATLAVAGVAAALVLSPVALPLAALAGLSAVAYLVLRHGATITRATTVGALSATAVAVAATAFPLDLPWVPLLVPLVVPALYLVVLAPFENRR